MPRQTPLDRLDRLVDVATAVFIERGYRRTQMADVAAALGVAKGTLYLAVESKEALFDLVVRFADAPRPIPPLAAAGADAGAGRDAAASSATSSSASRRRRALTDGARARTRVTDVRGELEAIVGELFDTLARNRAAREARRPRRARLAGAGGAVVRGRARRAGRAARRSTSTIASAGAGCGPCPTWRSRRGW